MLQYQASPADRERIFRSCTQFFGHPPRTIRESFTEAAAAASETEVPDRYGGGELLERFEAEIASLLGKEAATFMPSGTMAQQIALRVHCDRRSVRTVALHPQSHVVVHENGAMERLHDLRPVAVGNRHGLYRLEDLQSVPEPIAAVLVELPEREIGGALRPWNEVRAICEWARGRGIAVHLDGARLWETQPYYGMPLDRIASEFDTVYVSFYKILNAVAGAVLAGPKPIIDEARAWQWRHGGRLVQQYPMVISAREGLHRYLPRIHAYCDRARGIARVLVEFPDVAITPDPPPTNMMHVCVRGESRRLNAAALRVSEETRVWLAPAWRDTDVPGWAKMEISCAEGALSLTDAELRVAFARLLSYGRG